MPRPLTTEETTAPCRGSGRPGGVGGTGVVGGGVRGRRPHPGGRSPRSHGHPAPFRTAGAGGAGDGGRSGRGGGGDGGGGAPGGADETSGGAGPERPRLRKPGAALTALTALAATSLVAGPAVAGRPSEPCALERTRAHHSEGLDTWNAAYPRPRRSLDAALIFLAFPDSRPLTTPDDLFADYFPATTRFYRRASYGRFTLRPHPRRRWIEMPRPSTAYRIRRDWDAVHRSAYVRDAVAAADPHVDFGKYDLVYFVADPDAPGVDSDATKVVNFDRPQTVDGTSLKRIVTVFERHPPDRNVLAHETGHVFDLPDLYHRPSDGKGDWDTYVGDWDVMGSQFGLAPEFLAWHKWKLGWLDPRQVVCVQGGGSTRLALQPLSAPAERRAPVRAAGVAEEEAVVGPAGAARSERSVWSAQPGAGGPGETGGRGGASGANGASRGDRGGPAGATRREATAEAAGSAPVAAWTGGDPAAGTTARRTVPGVPRTARLLVVRTSRTSAIAFEARTARGNDASVCTQGVLVYRVRSTTESGGGPMEVIDAHPRTAACPDASVFPPLADAPVREGEHFRVPDDHVRIDLTVGGRTREGGWQVEIRTG